MLGGACRVGAARKVLGVCVGCWVMGAGCDGFCMIGACWVTGVGLVLGPECWALGGSWASFVECWVLGAGRVLGAWCWVGAGC